jgi:hypothetical protein
MAFSKANQKGSPRSKVRLAFQLSVEQGKVLAIVAAVALVLGLALSLIFQGRIADLQAGAEQMRSRNAAIANENVKLLAARAQVASKTQVAALAKSKLKLFEPDQGQVRRM